MTHAAICVSSNAGDFHTDGSIFLAAPFRSHVPVHFYISGALTHLQTRVLAEPFASTRLAGTDYTFRQSCFQQPGWS